MTERAPWWKAFVVRRKTGSVKEAATPLSPDFDPFALKPEKPKEASPRPPVDQQQQQQQQPPQGGDDTYDDSELDSVFNEKSCRRNMRVSRSGRFKEKRRVRSSLPIEEKEVAVGGGREERR